jgi:hypothetical protein
MATEKAAVVQIRPILYGRKGLLVKIEQITRDFRLHALDAGCLVNATACVNPSQQAQITCTDGLSN